MTKNKFSEGESVLCFQGNLIYDAKISEVRGGKSAGQQQEYYVHYKGWNKSWDEWVTDSRLLKNTAENLAKQKKLLDEVDPKTKHASKRGGASLDQNKLAAKKMKPNEKPESIATTDKKKDDKTVKKSKIVLEGVRSRSNSGSSIHSFKSNISTSSSKTSQKKQNDTKKKVKGITTTKQLTVNIEKPKLPRRMFGESIEVEIPENLKSVLVDDYDYMVRQRKLTSLPARINVENLLDAYKKSIAGRSGNEADVEEVCRGIKDYFNTTLGCQLLYKFERVQYSDQLVNHPGKSMSTLYGPIHLLRLMTKLGPMLNATDMQNSALKLLVSEVTKFLQYISKHRGTLFQVQDYGTASPEYHRRAL